MKRIEQEIYGFGPRLSTTHERWANFGIVLMLVSALGMLGVALWL